MQLAVELECEVDGRWIAEVPDLPGVLAYGQTRPESLARAEALALRVLAALLRLRWTVKRQSGSHRTLARLAKHTGLRPDEL